MCRSCFREVTLLKFDSKGCERLALAYEAPGLCAYQDACKAGKFSRKAALNLQQSKARFALDVLHAWRDSGVEAEA